MSVGADEPVLERSLTISRQALLDADRTTWIDGVDRIHETVLAPRRRLTFSFVVDRQVSQVDGWFGVPLLVLHPTIDPDDPAPCLAVQGPAIGSALASSVLRAVGTLPADGGPTATGTMRELTDELEHQPGTSLLLVSAADAAGTVVDRLAVFVDPAGSRGAWFVDPDSTVTLEPMSASAVWAAVVQIVAGSPRRSTRSA